jgi:hypothetical protein
MFKNSALKVFAQKVCRGLFLPLPPDPMPMHCLVLDVEIDNISPMSCLPNVTSFYGLSILDCAPAIFCNFSLLPTLHMHKI